jgi:hypothetical protein
MVGGKAPTGRSGEVGGLFRGNQLGCYLALHVIDSCGRVKPGLGRAGLLNWRHKIVPWSGSGSYGVWSYLVVVVVAGRCCLSGYRARKVELKMQADRQGQSGKR